MLVNEDRVLFVGDCQFMGAVRRMRTRIRLLIQLKSMRSIIDTTQ
jgi:hypothetical protein